MNQNTKNTRIRNSNTEKLCCYSCYNDIIGDYGVVDINEWPYVQFLYRKLCSGHLEWLNDKERINRNSTARVVKHSDKSPRLRKP